MRFPVDDFEGYFAFGLIEPGSDFDLNVAFDRITRALWPFFPDVGEGADEDELPFSSDGTKIDIDPNGIPMSLRLVQGPDVLEDARGLAGLSGDAVGAETAGRCDRRVEVLAPYPDRAGVAFARFARVVEVLRSFRGVLLLDPRNPAPTWGGRFSEAPWGSYQG
ncbi:MAG: hypothetical protein C0501_06765 [Isosphaera sp.]|nr:hypothetical protein [Isosphaera sp.]